MLNTVDVKTLVTAAWLLPGLNYIPEVRPGSRERLDRYHVVRGAGFCLGRLAGR